MRIYKLFHTVISKFVEMDETEKNELQLEAAKHYTQLKSEAELLRRKNQEAIEWNAANPESEPKATVTLSLKHKAIEFLELWWVRYLIAASFIFIVPKVKAIINGENSNEDGGEDEQSEYDTFKEYMRFRKSMI